MHIKNYEEYLVINMNDKIIFGQYYNSPSWFHRLDPRTKLIGIVLFMVVIFLLNSIYTILGMFAFTILLVLSTKIPFGKFVKSIRMMSTLLLVSVLFQVLFNKSGSLLAEYHFHLDGFNLVSAILILLMYIVLRKFLRGWKGIVLLIAFFSIFYIQYQVNLDRFGFFTKDFLDYHIKIYDDSLFVSLKIVLRIISLIVISSLLTLTTKPVELTQGMESLMKPLTYVKVNVSILAMMISIALRFIPSLINESQKILKAQASRGVDFQEAKLNKKIMQILSLLVPMFVISYKKAEDLAEAMEARGYIPGEKRSSIHVLKYKIKDIIAMIIPLLFLSSVIVLKVLGYAI